MDTVNKFSKHYAGFYPRMLASNIDLVILLPFFYLIGYYVNSNFILFCLCGLSYILYNTIFELSVWKGSVGKRLQRIRVAIDSSSTSLDFRHIFIRNLAKVLSVALLFSGFVMVFFDKRKRGLHDQIAGTIIIFTEI